MLGAAAADTEACSDRWRELVTAPLLAVLVDLDGTVIEFAPTPDEAVLDDEGARLLNELVAAGVQVVVVSGRASASIDALRSRVPGAWWVAEHGSWRWEQQLALQPPSRAPELDALLDQLAAAVATPGVLVERKTLSLCIHWRLTEPSVRDALRATLETVCDAWLGQHPGFERIAAVDALEVRPRNVSKGGAVAWVRDRLRGVRIIAVGDDVTDEDMFAELDDGDRSVSVGPRVTHADARAANVREARAFLRWIAQVRAGLELPLPVVPAADIAPRRRRRMLVMSSRTPVLGSASTPELGGRASAFEQALRDERAVWLGWSGDERGCASRLIVETTGGLAVARFDLPIADRLRFHAGFCHSVLWPLLHGFPQRVRYIEGDFDAYVRANARYARHACDLVQRDATIWVHDYQLMLVARALRVLGHEGRIGMFLDTPFPAPDVLHAIPWGARCVEAMLEFDLLGFQTQAFARNFLAAAHGSRSARKARVEVGVFPETIDLQRFRARTDERPEVAELRGALAGGRLIIGVDPLDDTRGVPERLLAYERLLDRYPEWRRRVTLLQVCVPSRAEAPGCSQLRDRVDTLVATINERYGDPRWVPVRTSHRDHGHDVRVQLYRLADVALVTPLCDGMGLVAKEFVAAQDVDRPGVLVLSKYVGAAETLASAVISDPYAAEGLAADLDRALRMPHAERMQRHRMLLRALDAEGDAQAWARRVLERLKPRPQRDDLMA